MSLESFMAASVMGTCGSLKLRLADRHVVSRLLPSGGRAWVIVKEIVAEYKQRGLARESAAVPKLTDWVNLTVCELVHQARSVAPAGSQESCFWESDIRPEEFVVQVNRFGLSFECRVTNLVVEQGWTNCPRSFE
jgi:hypothetical protein